MLRFFLVIAIAVLASCKTEQQPITFFMAGDSTVADKPYGLGNPEKGWGQVFPLYLKDGIKVDNHARNGRSTKSFIDEGRWDDLLLLVKQGDFVLIQFGHNDAKSEDSTRYAAAFTDYADNLKRFVTNVRDKGATPILATSIVRRKFNEEGVFEDTHGDYPDAVRQVAQVMDVVLFDLHQATMNLVKTFGPEKSKSLFLHISNNEYSHLTNEIVDDTHLSAYGAFKVSDIVMLEIKEKLPQISVYFKK